MSAPVRAATSWVSNAQMIADAHQLGYLRDDDIVLDPTYGRGTWWKVWRPGMLTTHDLAADGVDFRTLPYADGSFDVVAFDPPYKLNGTPTAEVDGRYGVDDYVSREARHELIRDGITECTRVCRRHLLVKCQDQVNGGKVRWQTRIFADHAEALGFELADSLLLLGGRSQPKGRSQVHARRNYSTLLVFAAPKRARRPTLDVVPLGPELIDVATGAFL